MTPSTPNASLAPPPTQPPPPWQRLIGFCAPYWGSFALGGLFILASAYANRLSPQVIRTAVDDLRSDITQEKVARYALLVVGIAAVRGLFLFWQRRILINRSRDIEYDLRNAFYAHLQQQPPAFFQRQRIGDLMSRATNDIGAVRMLIGPAALYGLNTLFTVALVLPSMVAINAALTSFALITLPLAAAATKYFGARIHERSEQIQEYFGLVTAKAQENFSSTRIVRAFAQEAAEEAAFDAMNREFVRRNLQLVKLSALFRPILDILFGLGPAIALWYGGRLVLRDELTLGQFVEFNLYLTMLVWPMIALGWVINLTQRGLASMGRLSKILDEAPAIRDATAASDLPPIKGDIELRHLTFAYPGHDGEPRPPALRDLSLMIPRGATLAIIGPTGAGKSTLANLLPRLLDAPPGTLLIDGRPIRDYPLDQLRAAIGYAQQESFLFSDTIAANIAFGVEQASPEAIAQAAEQAGLREDVERFPNGFETIVGERGITLSGGQKQRTALARALLRNPKILILDDALSAVDTDTEARILEHLRHVRRDRTTILIAHRISTVKDADHIVFLEEGRIIEQGTHAQLLALGGRYAALYERQKLEAELAAL
ncbi:MAG: multidrug ABC transporter ATP-binding protein [Chloracidobacterium sp. CP2_5A]|nr:MAG: multidrug ABC transporter ATP-binding protein [Chloracidobacterium sp. CP2_5A]